MNTKDFEEILDQVDAAIFTGDTLEDPFNVESLEYYIKRWQRQLLTRGEDK